MTEKCFQKRYVEKNNKVFDTWKNIPISRELDMYSLSHLLSHLNGLGEIIDTKIEQGRYCTKKNYELKQQIKELKTENEAQSDAIEGLQGFITHFDLEEIVK